MTICLQIATEAPDGDFPGQDAIERCVGRSLAAARRPANDLVVRVVDEPEMCELNRRFRGRNASTNVLAFPFEHPEEADHDYLGDIVICLPVVTTEARDRNISVSRHFFHMVIHGTLHLCGLDHDTDEKAEEMERLEQHVLARLGVD